MILIGEEGERLPFLEFWNPCMYIEGLQCFHSESCNMLIPLEHLQRLLRKHYRKLTAVQHFFRERCMRDSVRVSTMLAEKALRKTNGH